MGAIIKGNNKECEKPRCISVADKSSTKNFKIMSKSGMVPAIAPYSIALLPIFFPNVASATDAPRTICVKESIIWNLIIFLYSTIIPLLISANTFLKNQKSN